MRRATIIGLCSAGLLAIAPAVGQAAPVRWWVNPPAAYAELTPGTPETLKTGGAMGLLEGTGTTGVKCKVKDEEIIENPLSTTVNGIDKMVLWQGSCKGGPFPCVGTEKVRMTGLTPWASELIEVGGVYRDQFTGVAIEFECLTSHKVETYTENKFEPEVLVNKLVFSSTTNLLEAGIHKIYFNGTDKLKPVIYKKVEAK